MKQYPNIDAIIEDSDTKVQDLAKVIGVSTKQIRAGGTVPAKWASRSWRSCAGIITSAPTTFWGCPEIWGGPGADEDPGQLSIL